MSTRLVHWALAATFFGLLGSGLALESDDLRGIPFLGSKLVREIHLTWAVLLVVLPSLAASWDGFRDVARLWHEAGQFATDDVDWLWGLPRLGKRRTPLPPQGRLNAGQKLNVIAIAVLLLGLAGTGAILAPAAGRPVPQVIRELVYEVHRLLAFCTLPIVAAHVLLGAVWPVTRPALRGMVLGSVRTDWARAHHARWLAETTRDQDGPQDPTASSAWLG